MKSTVWEVQGMSCSGCSNSVKNTLKSLGLEEVFVDFSSGEVSFINTPGVAEPEIIKSIENLGFTVFSGENNDKKKGLTLG